MWQKVTKCDGRNSNRNGNGNDNVSGDCLWFCGFTYIIHVHEERIRQDMIGIVMVIVNPGRKPLVDHSPWLRSGGGMKLREPPLKMKKKKKKKIVMVMYMETTCGSVGSHTSSTCSRAKICWARLGNKLPTPFSRGRRLSAVQTYVDRVCWIGGGVSSCSCSVCKALGRRRRFCRRARMSNTNMVVKLQFKNNSLG